MNSFPALGNPTSSAQVRSVGYRLMRRPWRPARLLESSVSRRSPLAILARILKDRGLVTERQLQEAIQHQVLYGGRLGTSLYELGFITEERLRRPWPVPTACPPWTSGRSSRRRWP